MSKIVSVVAAATLAVLGVGAGKDEPPDAKTVAKWKDTSFYSMKTKTLEGKDADLKTYDGKVALVVNVASACGYTPQYEKIEKLYRELKDKGFVVLAFPCNDFGDQEPGTPEEIRKFCETKYFVTFPLFSKLHTKAGHSQSEIYNYLWARTGMLPSWNFGKYLIGRDGTPIAFYGSKTEPDDKALREAIDKALAAKAPTAKEPAAPAEPAKK